MQRGHSIIVGLASGLSAVALPSTAFAETRSYFDLTGSAGYSSNPFLQSEGDSSAFGRVSANGVHSIRGERGSTDFSAFVENSTYLKGYGSKQIFALSASTRYQVSELVQLFGTAEFSGDIGGQLLGRFEDASSVPEPDPGVPPPAEDVFAPDVLNLDRRQYLIGGQIGTTLTVSERDTVTVTASGKKVLYSEDSDDLNYSVATGSFAWQRKLSERTSAGAFMSVQRANYSDQERSTIFSPQLTLHTSLGVGWNADFAAGLSFVRRRTDSGSDQSVTPALDASVCRSTETERYCGHASYSTESGTSQSARDTIRVGVDYFNRLNAKDTIQANASLVRLTGDDFEAGDSKTSYYSAGASFSRRFSDRLSAGANVMARKSIQQGEGGIPFDASLSAFIRYRLGDRS
jgi:hypothetical protein